MKKFLLFISLILLSCLGFALHPAIGVIIFIIALSVLNAMFPKEKQETSPRVKQFSKVKQSSETPKRTRNHRQHTNANSDFYNVERDRKTRKNNSPTKKSTPNKQFKSEAAASTEKKQEKVRVYHQQKSVYNPPFIQEENEERDLLVELEEERERTEKEREEREGRRKEAEDNAYLYRVHGGPQWKIDAADDELGRTQFERDYEDERWGHVCDGCKEPERYCKCCRECDSYPCQCCSQCRSHPCECCNTCGYASCRCCSKCECYPCECCDNCGQPERYCKCCSKCESYPCECCNTCGEPERYCKCCRECDNYPCECCRNCRSHPCECCDTCGYASCRCCYRCREYPCECD